MISSERIILHLDLDYFFAQVEELTHPDSKGKPLVVCIYSGRTSDSGAVSTCNYVARKYGVKAGMPIIRAKKLLEGYDATFLRANHALYIQESAKVMEILRKYSEKFEQTSIDEAFIDITARTHNDYTISRNLGERIKKEIFDKLKLTSSIGIGPNKLIAKIASRVQKPNGLTIVKPNDVEQFLEYMEADAIPGIGKKTKEVLEGMSVRTISDLKRIDITKLVDVFGKKTAVWIAQSAKGIDESDVGMVEEQKQLSRIGTLKKDSRDISEITHHLEEMILDIKKDLALFSLTFEVIGISAIDSKMQPHSRSRKLPHPTSDENEIRKVAKELFEELINSTEVEFRRVGVKVEKLENKAGQKTLGEF